MIASWSLNSQAARFGVLFLVQFSSVSHVILKTSYVSFLKESYYNDARERKGGLCLKRPLKYLLVILAGILVGVMAYSSYKLISDKVEHSQARSKDQDATQSYVIAFPVSPTPRAYEEHVESGVQLDDEVSPLNSMYDLDKFYAQYPDAIGWIYCPDTAVDYGLVEAEDNDYYLHRFYDGSYSVSGSLFADCNNARDFSDENTVIYGHHMNDGTKFADIMYYKEQYYYDQHPIMYISTPTMNYRVELFTGFLCDADSETYTFRFDSDQAYAEWLQRMADNSDFKCNVHVSYKDRIVTLSTCSYEYYDARYVVMGKLVPIH